MKELEKEYSVHLDRTSKYDVDIRYFRKEVRMCDKALSFKEHAEKQIKNIDLEIDRSNQIHEKLK